MFFVCVEQIETKLFIGRTSMFGKYHPTSITKGLSHADDGLD